MTNFLKFPVTVLLAIISAFIFLLSFFLKEEKMALITNSWVKVVGLIVKKENSSNHNRLVVMNTALATILIMAFTYFVLKHFSYL